MAAVGQPQTVITPLLYGADGLPIPNTDGGSPIQQRGSRRGEAFVLNIVPHMGEASDDQSYFQTTTPTIGTAVTYGLQTAFSDVAGFMHIWNNDVPGGKRIILHQLGLICVIVGASATGVDFAIKMDTLPRIPTANASAITPVNTRSGSKIGSIAQVYIPLAGIPTMPAASAQARIIDRGRLRMTIPLAGDEYGLNFGAVDGTGPMAGTAVGRYVANVSPVTIDPGHSCTIYLWEPAVATTSPTFEISMGHIER